jgi:hypothetical protein
VIRRGLTVLLVIAALGAVAATPAAQARSRYCSTTGDLCFGAFGHGAKVQLRLTLIARFFTRYQLCVTAPDGTRECRRFRLQRVAHGLYDSRVRWARRFPVLGPGTYHARWRHAGRAIGPRVAFAEGPSIHVRPHAARAGSRVRVYGLAGGCPAGDQVTLLSRAFPHTHDFAGVPAVFATVDADDSYSVRVRIPAGRAPGRYAIGARCGGGNFGVQGSVRVLP